MRLSRLRVKRLPGLADPFEIEAKPGINLIVGPNGSGKSSLTRAMFHLLWPQLQDVKPCDVIADFHFQEKTWQAAHQDGLPLQWTREGQPVSAPGVPDLHLAGSYKLGMLDLNLAEIGDDDHELARQIRTHMDGGFDLARTEEKLFKVAPMAGRNEKNQQDEATGQALALKASHRNLAVRERSLDGLEKQLATARLAESRAHQLGRILELRQKDRDLKATADRLATIPAGVAQVRENDPEDLAALRQQEKRHQADLISHQKILEQLSTRLEAKGTDDTGLQPLSTGLLSRLIDEYEDCSRLRDQAARNLATAQSPLEATNGQPGKAVDRQTYNHLTEAHAQLLGQNAGLETRQQQLGDLESLSTGPPPWTWPLLVLGTAAAGTGAWLLFKGYPIHWLALVVAGLVGLLIGFFLWGRGKDQTVPRQIKSLHKEIASLERERSRTLGQLQDLAAEHSLDLDNPHLLHDLKNLALRLDAQADAHKAQAELEHQQSQLDQALDRINEQLAGARLDAAAGVAPARQRLEDLREDERERERVQSEMEKEELALAHTRMNLEQTGKSLEGLFTRLGLDPVTDGDQAVDDLLARWPQLEETRDLQAAAHRDITRLESDIAESGHLLDPAGVQDHTTDQLKLMIAQEQEQAASVSRLVDEIAEIRQEIKAATSGQTLAQAMALEDQRRLELEQKRDEVRRSMLGRLVLQRVREQNEASSRPPVLSRAQELFHLYTGGQYELLVAADPEGRTTFRALDTDSGRYLDLGQLSDGTRAQLLLAVRLGFIFTAESDVRPPLFLDDSLTASDPARFALVAASLGHAAQDHSRQIFYLTASCADVEAWRAALQDAQLGPPHIIDLSLARKLGAAAALGQLVPPDTDPIGEPVGQSPEEYARQLLVPRLDGWAAPTAAHLFYLLPDQLDLLHQLMTAGSVTLGRWEKNRAQLLETGALSSGQDQLVAIRCEVWIALLDAWRVGRGRPVLMEDLDPSGAVTSTMRPKVSEVLRDCHHDAELLMAALAAGKVPRFLENKKKLLQDYLEQHGFFDTRDVLDLEGLVARVRGALAVRLSSGAVTGAELRILVQNLAGFLDQSA